MADVALSDITLIETSKTGPLSRSILAEQHDKRDQVLEVTTAAYEYLFCNTLSSGLLLWCQPILPTPIVPTF